jgi:carboxyl-terminal processing protease
VARRFAFIIVATVRPGSPAEKAKVKPGDVIKSIDGRHSRTLSVPLAEALLRGAPGSVLKLKLVRSRNVVADVDLVREKPAPLAAQNRVLEEGIGYLKIQEFSVHTAEEVETGLATLTRGGAKRLVLDLRGNIQGAPEEAVAVASLFIKDGVITRLVSRHAAERTFSADKGQPKWTLPVAVLVDATTGGAGEVLGAALSEAGRATLVGERTFGHAGVQKTVPVADGAFVLTVGKYLTPKGKEIHGKGLEPEVAVQAREDDEDEAAGSSEPAPDAILEKAIEILKADTLRRAA